MSNDLCNQWICRCGGYNGENEYTFSYNINLEVPTSWRRVNSYSQEELIQAGLETRVAAKIIQERETNGIYRSALEISKRTGLPLTTFQHLIQAIAPKK